MLRISRMADYGTVIMVFLARAGGLRNVSEIVTGTHLAKPTVSKLVKRLSNAELLISERGAKGGYQLGRQPQLVTIVDIIEAIEGKKGLTDCIDSHLTCSLVAHCHVSRHWAKINKALKSTLQQFNLSMLMQPLDYK